MSFLSRFGAPIVLVLFVILSRAIYVSDFIGISRDGPNYVNALNLDPTYDVPPPGNIGFVMLSWVVHQVHPNPVHAYAFATIAISVMAAVFIMLFAGLYLSRPLAIATSWAMMCGPLVWCYGTVIVSYGVWLAFYPAIGYFGIRYLREHRPWQLHTAAALTGISSIFRPDMVAFAGPLLAGILILGRAPLKLWIISFITCAACACAWFFGTAAVLGGVRRYLDLVAAKNEFNYSFSFNAKGLFEGLIRNTVKYAMFLGWNSGLLILPAAVFVLARFRHAPRYWKELTLMALWMAPSLYFGLIVFMGTGALMFPLLPLLGVAATKGLLILFRQREPRAVVAMAALGLASLVQFVLSPILPSGHQRNVIINVMFTKHGGPATRSGYYYNLEDFGIDPSLGNVLRQLRENEPVPKYPPDFKGPK